MEKNRRLELFRFNEQTGEWKKLSIEFNGSGCFFSIEQGKKGDKEAIQRLTLKLDMAEVALLQTALFKGLLKNLEV